MPTPSKRQPRAVISVSVMHVDWERASRAAAQEGQTLSEYVRAAIRTANASRLDPPAAAAA